MKCVNKKTKTLDLIATIMIETSTSYENAEVLLRSYMYMYNNNIKIPSELEELISSSIKNNNKNLYWLLKLILVSPDFILGLTIKWNCLYNILLAKKYTI